MRPIRTFHRPNVLDGERRPVRKNPEQQGALEYVASGIADWTKWLKDKLGETGKGIVKGLSDGWNYSNLVESHKQKEMASISNSLTIMPKGMLDVLESEFAKGERLTLEELAPLFQLDTWSKAFETDGIFDVTREPVKPMGSLAEGPLGILRSLDGARRRELFVDYFDALVPPSVGMPSDLDDPETRDAVAAYHTIVSNVTVGEPLDPADPAAKQKFEQRLAEALSPENRARFLFADPARVSQAQAAIGGVLGRPDKVPTADTNAPAYLVARSALRRHYWIDGLRSVNGQELPLQKGPLLRQVPGQTSQLALGVKPRLFDDVSSAIRAGTRGANANQLRQALPPSFLKGALATNVISQADLANIEATLGNRDAALTRARQSAKDEYLELSGVVRSERVKEGTDFAATFSRLSGFEKLALVAAGLFLAAKMPGITAGAAVWYFGSKFLLNQKDPVNQSLAPKVKGLADWINGTVNGATGGMFPTDGRLTVDGATKRVDTMKKFLTENVQRDVDSAVTGFSVLGDMRLRDLANAMVLGDDSGQFPPAATLNVSSPSFQFLRQKLREKGVRSSAVRRFFVDGPVAANAMTEGLPEKKTNANLLDAGNSLMVVFYLVAARDEEHRDMVKRIERFRQASDGRYESLPVGVVTAYDGVKINPRQEFMRLVRKGMENAPEQSLLQFVQGEIARDGLKAPYMEEAAPDPKEPAKPATAEPTTPTRPAEDGGVTPTRPGEAPPVAPTLPARDDGSVPSRPGEAPPVDPTRPAEDGGSVPARPGEAPPVDPSRPARDGGSVPGRPAVREGIAPTVPSTDAGRDPSRPAGRPSSSPARSASDGGSSATRSGAGSASTPERASGDGGRGASRSSERPSGDAASSARDSGVDGTKPSAPAPSRTDLPPSDPGKKPTKPAR